MEGNSYLRDDLEALKRGERPEDAGEIAGRALAVMEHLEEALAFYADPETYFAIGFFPDPPCGPFMDDFEDTRVLGIKPGKRARAALDRER